MALVQYIKVEGTWQLKQQSAYGDVEIEDITAYCFEDEMLQ